MRMTAKQIADGKRELDLLTKRLARLNAFIDDGAPSTPACVAIMYDARDVLEQEKLNLELRLSLALPRRVHDDASVS